MFSVRAVPIPHHNLADVHRKAQRLLQDLHEAHEAVIPDSHIGARDLILEFASRSARWVRGALRRKAMLVLQCGVQGRNSSSFVVPIDENASVLELMETILQNHQYSMPCSTAELTLFCSAQTSTTNGDGNSSDDVEMDRTKSLAEYFPPRPSFQQEEHYRVRIALPAHLTSSTDDDSAPATKKRKKLELADCFPYPASEPEADIAVTLLCAAFGGFEDNCQHGSVVELTKKDCELVFALCHAMTEDYASDEEQAKRVKDLLGDYLLSNLPASPPEVQQQRQQQQNSNTFVHRPTRELWQFEVKAHNERKRCSTDEYLNNLPSEVSDALPLPCFLLEIAGPFLRVYGVVYTGKKLYCEPLVPSLPLVWVDKLSLMESVARVCTALKIAVHELHAAQMEVNTTICQLEMEFPYKSTAMIDGEQVSIQYEERIQGLVFAATAIELGEREVIVKFAKMRYGREVHEHCAAIGLAPKLLAHEQLPGGWYFCVMEMVENAVPIWEMERGLVESKLREIPKLLRAADFVHGDLRIYNILWDPNAQQLKLVDFDWAGRQGVTKYPPFLCPEVPWPEGVETNKVIEFAHDEFWIHEFLDA